MCNRQRFTVSHMQQTNSCAGAKGLRVYVYANLTLSLIALFPSRIFWIICCSLCSISSLILIITSYNNILGNVVSFAMETSHVNWTTKFPTIFICENQYELPSAEKNAFHIFYIPAKLICIFFSRMYVDDNFDGFNGKSSELMPNYVSQESTSAKV